MNQELHWLKELQESLEGNYLGRGPDISCKKNLCLHYLKIVEREMLELDRMLNPLPDPNASGDMPF